MMTTMPKTKTSSTNVTTTSLAKRIQEIVLPRLKPSFVPERLPGLEDHALRLKEMLRRTIEDGENSLVLVEGRQGSGKTVLVRHVLETLKEKHEKLIVATINGFCYTSDHAAMKHLNEIMANAFRDERHGSNNTFLMSVAGSLANQNYFHRTLQDRCREGATVVIVLEQFESFTRRNRQTMLYNILDLTQHVDTRMSVICVTRQINSAQRLEKRIRSRFDLSRQIILSQTTPSIDRQFEILKARLLLEPSDNDDRTSDSGVGAIESSARKVYNKSVDSTLKECKRKFESYRRLGMSLSWILRAVSLTVAKLHRTSAAGAGDSDRDVPKRRKIAASSSSTIDQPALSSKVLNETLGSLFPGKDLDTMVAIASLSEPAVALLIALKRLRLRTTGEGGFYNFKMAVDEYKVYRGTSGSAANLPEYSENVMLQAFMQLIRFGLVTTAKGELTSDLLLPFVAVVLLVDMTCDSLTKAISKWQRQCHPSLKRWNAQRA